MILLEYCKCVVLQLFFVEVIGKKCEKEYNYSIKTDEKGMYIWFVIFLSGGS
jgi:hypothetical protein